MKSRLFVILAITVLSLFGIMSPSVAMGQEGGFAASISRDGAQAVAMTHLGTFENVRIFNFNLGNIDASALWGMRSGVSVGFAITKRAPFADNAFLHAGIGFKPIEIDVGDRFRIVPTLVVGGSWRF